MSSLNYGPGQTVPNLVVAKVGADGTIDPNAGTSLTHPEALDKADAIVMLVRFRKWPDETMKRFDAALDDHTHLATVTGDADAANKTATTNPTTELLSRCAIWATNES